MVDVTSRVLMRAGHTFVTGRSAASTASAGTSSLPAGRETGRRPWRMRLRRDEALKPHRSPSAANVKNSGRVVITQGPDLSILAQSLPSPGSGGQSDQAAVFATQSRKIQNRMNADEYGQNLPIYNSLYFSYLLALVLTRLYVRASCAREGNLFK